LSIFNMPAQWHAKSFSYQGLKPQNAKKIDSSAWLNDAPWALAVSPRGFCNDQSSLHIPYLAFFRVCINTQGSKATL